MFQPLCSSLTGIWHPLLGRDVDDLKEIGDLELYVDQTLVINIFLSHSYFKSKNCLREVEATVDKIKPLMLTHEVEVPKGGGPLEEIKAELDDDRLKEAVFSEGRQITIWYRIAECTPLRPKLHFFLK